MKINCAFDEMVKIIALQPHPQNRNKHSKDQIERLAKIIKYQGWRSPIKVSNQSGFITSGHGRLAAAQLMKYTEVPVDFQDYDNADQEYADVQADNAIASWAELDTDAITDDLKSIGADFDVDMLGIKDFTIDDPTKDVNIDDDEVPETAQNEFGVDRGQIWQLGAHRLMCGDSTNADDVARLMNGDKADMVFTDPPYGIDLDTDYTALKSARVANKFERVANDDKDFNPISIIEYFASAREMFWFGANYYSDKLPDRNAGSWVVWDKRINENLDKMYGSAFELCWSKVAHKQEIARITWAGCFGHNKTDDGAKKVHPTMKPIALIQWFFDRWGKPNDLVADLFLGSGSTLIACEKTNRKCYGMEIDPHYCSVIIKRWQDFTGNKAVLQ